jgi:hypothetical protein
LVIKHEADSRRIAKVEQEVKGMRSDIEKLLKELLNPQDAEEAEPQESSKLKMKKKMKDTDFQPSVL